MKWACYKPVLGTSFRINATVLGSTGNPATVAITVEINNKSQRKVASALVTAYLRGIKE